MSMFFLNSWMYNKKMKNLPPASLVLTEKDIPHRVFEHQNSIRTINQAAEERGQDEGISYYPWSNVPNDLYPPHLHSYSKIIYVVRGSITFILSNEETLPLHPGDRLELPANTVHSAVVGSQGVACLEAHY